MTRHHCSFPSAQCSDRAGPETAAFTSTAVRASTATMVRVEGGRFLMDSDDALSHPDHGEGPVREATAVRLLHRCLRGVERGLRRLRRGYELYQRGRALWVLLRVRRTPARPLPPIHRVASAPWWRLIERADWRIPRGRNPMSLTDRRTPSCTSRTPRHRPARAAVPVERGTGTGGPTPREALPRTLPQLQHGRGRRHGTCPVAARGRRQGARVPSPRAGRMSAFRLRPVRG